MARKRNSSLERVLLAIRGCELKISSIEINSENGNITIRIESNENATPDFEEKMATQALNEWLAKNED